MTTRRYIKDFLTLLVFMVAFGFVVDLLTDASGWRRWLAGMVVGAVVTWQLRLFDPEAPR